MKARELYGSRTAHRSGRRFYGGHLRLRGTATVPLCALLRGGHTSWLLPLRLQVVHVAGALQPVLQNHARLRQGRAGGTGRQTVRRVRAAPGAGGAGRVAPDARGASALDGTAVAGDGDAGGSKRARVRER